MKKLRFNGVILPLFMGLLSVSISAQEIIPEEKITDPKTGLKVFNQNTSYQLSDAKTIFKKHLKIKSSDALVQTVSKKDDLGFTHDKYQQHYKGVKVEFADYTLHAKDGKVSAMSGEFYDLNEINITPSISKEQGLQAALNHIGAKSYMWENEAVSNQLNYKKPTGELVLLPNLDEQVKGSKHNAQLAYKYDIYAMEPLSRGVLYIDAATGAPLFYNTTIKHLGEHSNSSKHLKIDATEDFCDTNATMEIRATGNAATRYSGTRRITTRVVGSSYALRDNTRGGGINTYNSRGQASYPSTNFTDTNNDWTAAEFNNSRKDNAALDAHWGAAQTYDYLRSVHGRNSYNGSGAAINSWVHYDDQPGGAGYDNAFWNGSVMTYGDGSSNGSEGNGTFDALTSLDVAAHEIGHAVTSSTANLAYRRESGGLNEGFSDIWGAAVEHFANGGNDRSPSRDVWLIGEDIDRRSGVSALRSMSDPNSRNQPDTYGGTYWKEPNCGTPTQANDQCGVHTNSGVLNHWFYRTVVGGSGTNDVGNRYNVSGIGMNKSAKIAYRTLNVYLSANSTFANARSGSIRAAKDLYGAGGAEEKAVTNAWHAVGVGAAYSGGGTTGGSNSCDGVAAYSSSKSYSVGDRVTSGGNLYQRTSSGWTNLGACETTTSSDPCSGVAAYSSSKSYSVGDRVTSGGNLYQRTSSGWTNLGACGSTTSSDPCSGVAAYYSSRSYSVGDRVTSGGNLYQRTSSGWTNLGACGSSSANGVAIGTVDSLENVEISVYPNPVAGSKLYVKSNSKNLPYKITNMIGQQVSKGTMNSNEINVSTLNAGLYIIQFNVNEKIQTRKFVKE